MNGLTGSGILLSLALRRDRVLLSVSALALTALSVGSAQATVALYPDADAAIRGLGSVLSSPATLALYGPASVTSIEGLSIFKTLLLGAVFVALLAFTLVRRHTRVEEEEGRLELIGAGGVGRQAPLTAAVLLALLSTTVIAGLSALGLVAIGFPLTGSLAFAAAWIIGGLLMTGVTAIACQLTSSARGATGWALGTFGLLFALRALGDTGGDTSKGLLRWVSPLGWVNQVFPYGRNRLWLVLPALLLCGGLVAVAFLLRERRDLGAGLLAGRPGPAQGGIGLRSPLGLVWRQGRASVLGWVVATALVGVLYGSLVPQVGDMLSDPNTKALIATMVGVPVSELAGALTSVYVATMIKVSAAAMGAAGLVLVLRLGTEERNGRTEPVLASATGRTHWYLIHVLGAMVFSALLSLLLALVTALLGSAASAQAPGLGQVLQAAAETVPANLVLIGVGALLAGANPRWAPWAWGVLGLAYVLGEFGATMGLPTWLAGISPFAHVVTYPMGVWDWASILPLTAVAALLVVAGAIAHRRRDIG